MAYLLKYKIINTLVITLVCFLVLIIPTFVFGEANKLKAVEQADVNFIHEFLFLIVNEVFGTMVWYAAMLLNFAVTDYVIGFGNQFINSGLGVAINSLWTTVRDIFNLTFIFGLVYIGFKMILDSSDSNARKMLVHIILAALLVNFSLFFTKFIVDFSNIAATQIAQGFEVGQIGGVDKYLIADKFIDEMGVSSIWGEGKELSKLVNGGASAYTYIFGMMIIFIITAFVFFVGGILLMIRFVVLNLYMILSPIMFLGWVFPGLASYSQMWWSGFLARAFFAPAYLLMLYFAATILTEFAALNKESGTKGMGDFLMDPAKNQEAFGNIVPYFAMMAIFLIAAVIVAQKMAGQGGEMAMSMGKSIAGRTRQAVQRGAGSVTFGAAGFVGQKTIGLGASKLSESQSMKKFASKYGAVGKYAMNKTRAVADSSMDFRRTGIGKTLNMGEGVAGGYTSRVNEKIKEDQIFAEKLGEVQIKDATGKYLEGVNERIEEGITDSQEYKDISTLEQTAKNNLDAITKLVNDKRTELKTAKDQMTKDINSLEQQLVLVKNNPQETARINSELEKAKEDEKRLENDFSKLELSETKAKTDLKKVEADKVNLEKTLRTKQEASIVFEHQLAFIEQREKDSKFYKTERSLLGGAFGGVAGGGGATTLAGVTGIGAAPLVILAGAGASSMYSISDESAKSAKNLRRIYGLDGTNKIKLNQKKADLKILSDVTNDVNNQSGDTVSQGGSVSSSTTPKSA